MGGLSLQGRARARIVVVLARKVIVHSFTNTPQRLSVFDTHENNAGASAVIARPMRSGLGLTSRSSAVAAESGDAQVFARCVQAPTPRYWPSQGKHPARSTWSTLAAHASSP